MVFDFDTMNNAWNGLFALSENCKLGQVDLHAARSEWTAIVAQTRHELLLERVESFPNTSQ
ncbi:hypothetical protein PMI31_05932 [Pseudomonas sp. GM55]|jgi:hypothetical protein|nr:hypothetical protein PMI31_05932 [Pseudomonas sp. GM55]